MSLHFCVLLFVIFDVFKTLPSGVQTLGLVGFLMLGTRGKAIVLLIGGVLYKPHGKVRYGFIAESFIKSNKDLFETN